MKVGVMLPRGMWDEFRGMEPHQAWNGLRQVATDAEDLGFDSIWLSDHFTPIEDNPDAILLEAMTTLAALAAVTHRVRLGTLVLCAPFRNPGLTAKMLSTLDAISGGRVELGIGAGWKEDEFRLYGYEFPATRERLALLADHLEVITRMLAAGNPVQQPRLPIMVGGNGRQVTWRLAARYADELNLDGLLPDEVAAAMPIIQARCGELGRDPSDLRISVYAGPRLLAPGAVRVAAFRRYAELGLTRVIVDLNPEAIRSRSHIEQLAHDASAAGFALQVA